MTGLSTGVMRCGATHRPQTPSWNRSSRLICRRPPSPSLILLFSDDLECQMFETQNSSLLCLVILLLAGCPQLKCYCDHASVPTPSNTHVQPFGQCFHRDLDTDASSPRQRLGSFLPGQELGTWSLELQVSHKVSNAGHIAG